MNGATHKARWTAATALPRLLLVALAGVALALLAVRLDLLQQHRTDIAGAEFNVVYGVQKLMLGQPLYQDPELPPFDIVQYTPLYHAACAAVGSILGVDPLDPHSVFLVSRWLSLLFNLATVLLVFVTVRRMTSWPFALWAALLTFAAFSQHFFSRSDSLYALFFVGAIHCITRWSDAASTRRNRWLTLAAVCAVLALMAKQTGAFVLVLIPLYLCFIREWRALLRFSAVAGLMLAFSLGAVMITVPLEIFQKNVVQGLMNGMSFRFLRMMLQPHLYMHYIVWHIASIALVTPLLRQRHPDLRFFATALPISLSFSFVTALKSGSDFNYFFENMVLVFMALALYFGGAARLETPGSRWTVIRPWLGVAVMAYSLSFSVHRTRMFRGWSLHHSEPEALMAAYRDDRQVRDALREEMGLRDDEGIFITYRGPLEHLMVGQSMLTQKDIIEWSVDPPFDYTAFDRAMRDGTIRFVISDQPLDPLQVMGRTYTGFREVKQVGSRRILARDPG
jgi:hypothetical protein